MSKTDYYIPLYKNNLYHIYNRGNGNENIFYTSENYVYFLKQYFKYTNGLIDTFAFCLLPNHFHLLIRTMVDDPQMISEAFRKLFISYSMSINKQQKRKGNLFQRGFKRKLIDDERYFYTAVYYIHSNPVHHNLVKDFRDYKYSSFNLLSSERNTNLLRNEVYEWFGGKENFIDYHLKSDIRIIDDNLIIEDE